MDDIRVGEQGTVTVAAIGSSAVHVLPELLCQFRSAHPQIDVILRTAGGDEIRDQVKHNQVNFGIVGSIPSIASFRSVAPVVRPRWPLAESGH